MPALHYSIVLQTFRIIAFAMLTGCAAVGPDYEKPDMQTPDAWQAVVATEVADGSDAVLQSWWTLFNDPLLTDLIERARQSNLDLKIATSRIREARAKFALTTGARWPTIDAGGGVKRTEQSDDGALRELTPAGGFEPQSLYELGLDATWELDVFGRVRRTIEAAGAQYQASIEDQRDVMVTLFAEVVLNYVKLREYQQRIAVARDNSRGQQESLKLAQDKFSAGISSKLDVLQAQYNLANTQAAVPPLEIERNLALNRLAVLLGQDPGSLNLELAEEKPLPTQLSNHGIGVPADVLRQRPDIRRAERQLAAQTALIGVATAGLYPDFSLSGFIGFQSKKTSDLFNSDSLAWGIGLPVEWTLFDGGRIRSNINIQDERAEQNLLSYQKSVLTALAEVENAVVAINQDAIQRNLLTQATQAGIEAVRLVLIQYDAGVTDFNNVLTTQRDLFVQQEQLVSSEARFVIDYIQLYKALGGGWDIAATETTGP